MSAGASYTVMCPTSGHGIQQVINHRQEAGWGNQMELACGCRMSGTQVATQSTTGVSTGTPGRPWDGKRKYSD